MTPVEQENKITILVIDDQASNLAVLVGFLESKEIEVVVAENGKNGIARAKHVQPDLILLDVLMPGIDGFETCLQLKSEESTAKIPVIFMTALTNEDDKVKGFTVGGSDYITKPIQFEEVWARINTHLKLSRLQASLEQNNRQLSQEVEERRQAEQQVNKQMEFLHTVINSLPYPFYVIDAEDYRIVLANNLTTDEDTWKDATCYEVRRGLSQPCDEETLSCPLQKVKNSGKPVVIEHEQLDSHGSPQHLEIHGYPITDAGGRVVQMIEYAVDISQRKQMEAEREQIIEKLQTALDQVKMLSGIVPICMYCKEIRDDQGYWSLLEDFISEHSEAEFSHSICPKCLKEKFPEQSDSILNK